MRLLAEDAIDFLSGGILILALNKSKRIGI